MKIITYAYEEEFASNCHMLYVGEKEVVLFDVGQPNARFYKKLQEKGLIVKAIFLTHAHFDHIQGIDFFSSDIPVYISYQGIEACQNPYENASFLDGKEVVVHHPLLPLRDQEVVTIEGHEILVIETPFHTLDSLCFLIDRQVLISGDTLFYHGVGRSDLPRGCPRYYSSSMQKLKQIYLQYGNLPVYTGHGKNTTLEEEMRNLDV